MRKSFKIYVGKPGRKRPLGRPSRRWKDNIKMYVQEIDSEGVEWINLAQGRDQWQTCEYDNEPSSSVKVSC
jgi:hypothetical protein